VSESVNLTPADLNAIRAMLADAGRVDTRPFYTTRTLAERLKVTDRTVRSMLASGKIASFKIEGSRRIAPADVDAYLDGCREERAA
jgi:excisionase family DNA binding protein